MTPKVFRVEDVMRIFDVSRQTVYRWRKESEQGLNDIRHRDSGCQSAAKRSVPISALQDKHTKRNIDHCSGVGYVSYRQEVYLADRSNSERTG